MRNCDTLQEDLKAYRDGQLPPLPRLRVRLHLKRCESCRQEIEEMGRIGRKLHNMDLDNDRLDPSLRARILASIPDGLPDPPDPVSTSAWRRKPTMVWGGLAAAALTLVLFYPTLRTMTAPERMKARAMSPSAGTSPSLAAPPTSVQDYDEASAPSANTAPGGSLKSGAVDSSRGTPAAPDGRTAFSNPSGGGRDGAPPLSPNASMAPNAPASGSIQADGYDGHAKASEKTATNALANEMSAAPPSPAQGSFDSGLKFSAPQTATSTTPGGRAAGAPSSASSDYSRLKPATAAPTDRPALKADRETTLVFLVQDLPAGSKQVNKIVKDAGGQTVPAPVSTDKKSKVFLFEADVPAAKFDAVVQRLSQMKGLYRDRRLDYYKEAQGVTERNAHHRPPVSAPQQPQKQVRGKSTQGGQQSVTNMGTESPLKAEAGGPSVRTVLPAPTVTTPSKSERSPALPPPDKAPPGALAQAARMHADGLQTPPVAAPKMRTKAELEKKSKPASRGVIHIELKEAPK